MTTTQHNNDKTRQRCDTMTDNDDKPRQQHDNSTPMTAHNDDRTQQQRGDTTDSEDHPSSTRLWSITWQPFCRHHWMALVCLRQFHKTDRETNLV